ncbi:MAG TPA: alpha-hydroxy acid oxidase [Solirubrobacteraceae bacterium]|nr:alpha-hydroxy acid oxidase [Solirubrobacteraceae bacterium]
MTTIAFKLSGRQPPVSVEGYRRAARRAVPLMVWTYVDGAADDWVTLAENRDAFGQWWLRQRVLTGHAHHDLTIQLEGERLALPVLVAPTGLNGLSHWQGDIAVARGAEDAGTRLVLSSAGTHSIEEVAAAARARHWFQLYPWRDRELIGSLIERARRSGYRSMVVTVDVPAVGNREGERLHGLGLPPVLTPRRVLDAGLHPRWAYGFLRHRRVSLRNLVDAGGIAAGTASAELQTQQLNVGHINWEDFAWIRERWAGPLYIKGVMDSEDADQAVSLGADGVVVSNHGGRQLDGTVSALGALGPIADRVGDRVTVLFDGGIRRGSDVVKALCLGADACLVGRAAVYGLIVAGAAGVADVLRILGDEIVRTLTLMGVPSVAELDRSWLIPRGAPERAPDLEP